MGEYCEFDNFSCDGPKCNEGPYSVIAPGGVGVSSVMPSPRILIPADEDTDVADNTDAK